MNQRQWFRFEQSTSDASAVDIQIIDFIGDWIDDYFGFGVTAKVFVDQLEKLPAAVKTIRVHINSPGGDVAGALNIANALRGERLYKQRTVETIVDGWALSAATLVMMAGDPVRIADNGQVFVHNPWTVIGGNAAQLRKMADDLDKTARDSIVSTYQWHSSLTEDEILALMNGEDGSGTWLGADEAIAHGFATEKIVGLKAAACLDARMVARLPIPEKYRDRVAALVRPEPKAPEPADPKAVIQACKAAGFPELAEDLLDQPLEQVQARLAEATATRDAAAAQDKAARAAAEARATEIRKLCALASVPAEIADDYIAGGMALPQVRSQLTNLRPLMAGGPIDNRQPPTGARAGAGEAATRITDAYAALNRREGRTS